MSDHADILSAVGILVLARVSGDVFVSRADVPEWCRRLGAGVVTRSVPFSVRDVFPFMELFVQDAEACWSGTSARMDSDGFTQIAPDGEELHLMAVALNARSEALLLVMENEVSFAVERTMLQRARELRFAHDALAREIERKEVLAHCVVHDLRNPLNSILGALSILEQTSPSPHDARLVQLALAAAKRQDVLIREILEVFSAEKNASLDVGRGKSADLREVVAQVANMLEPRARTRNTALRVVAPTDEPMPVVADEVRLFRVVSNLVENAIRYSPPNELVTIAILPEGGDVVVSVEDRGPGVAPSFLPNLFKKFSRAGDGGAGTGLGLYFCRITVEKWGGSVGYEPGRARGARFWIRLVRASTGSVEMEGQRAVGFP